MRAALAVALLLFGLREPASQSGVRRRNPIRRENLRRLGGDYWWVVGIGAVFSRFNRGLASLSDRYQGILGRTLAPNIPAMPIKTALVLVLETTPEAAE